MLADSALSFVGFRRTVHVSPAVTDTWDSHRQEAKGAPESFGVLVGATSNDRREVWIEDVTTPMPLDRRSRLHFELRDPHHQRIVDQGFLGSGGSRIYLGTWHTHPQSKPRPSQVDEDDWGRCVRRNRGRPLIFVIVGLEEIGAFLRWGKAFNPLRVMLGKVA